LLLRIFLLKYVLDVIACEIVLSWFVYWIAIGHSKFYNECVSFRSYFLFLSLIITLSFVVKSVRLAANLSLCIYECACFSQRPFKSYFEVTHLFPRFRMLLIFISLSSFLTLVVVLWWLRSLNLQGNQLRKNQKKLSNFIPRNILLKIVFATNICSLFVCFFFVTTKVSDAIFLKQ
jgi:hypothetical protein